MPPAVLYLEPEKFSVLLVRYSSADGFPDLRKYIKEQWVGLMPDQPFECLTLSEFFGRVFGLFGSRFPDFESRLGQSCQLPPL